MRPARRGAERRDLGDLKPDDVSVQLYSGPLTSKGYIEKGEARELKVTGGSGSKHTFEGDLVYQSSGERGLSVRVLPRHEDLADPFLLGYIRWAGEEQAQPVKV